VSLDIITDNSQLIIAFCAALAMFSAVVVIGWPYLAGDQLTNRMRQISSERERIRARERAKLESQKKQASLRVEPKKFFKDIVDRFNLNRQTEDGCGAAAEAHRADDPLLPAGALRRHHHAGDHPGHRGRRPQPLARGLISGRPHAPTGLKVRRSDRLT
jgi:hypothetical protein